MLHLSTEGEGTRLWLGFVPYTSDPRGLVFAKGGVYEPSLARVRWLQWDEAGDTPPELAQMASSRELGALSSRGQASSLLLPPFPGAKTTQK